MSAEIGERLENDSKVIDRASHRAVDKQYAHITGPHDVQKLSRLESRVDGYRYRPYSSGCKLCGEVFGVLGEQNSHLLLMRNTQTK
jgi:hypothetical protein